MNEIIVSALSRFGHDELRNFLPKSARQLLVGVNKLKDEVELNSSKLARVIWHNFPERFLRDPSAFIEVIEHFDEKDVAQIILGDREKFKEVTPSHYMELKRFYQSDLRAFLDKISALEDYNAIQVMNETKIQLRRVKPNFKLFEYQADISRTVLSKMRREKNARMLIHMPTGSGKTRTAMNVVCEHLRENNDNLVVWLTDREELCQQAVSTFELAWGNLGLYDSTVYSFFSDTDDTVGGVESGFLVAGLQKIHALKSSKKRNTKLLYEILCNEVTLIVFDEAHKSIADTYRAIIEDIILRNDIPFIGLSATPGREYSEDGLTPADMKLAAFFNMQKISMEIRGYLSPIDFLVQNKYLADVTFYPLHYKYSKILGDNISRFAENRTEIVQMLATDSDRNAILLETIMKEVNNGSQIIVFATSVEHSVNLAVLLSYSGVAAVSIDSNNDTKLTRRLKVERYLKKEIQILVNFNVLTTGFDAPKTNVVIIARPVSSLVQYFQMVGRAMRGEHSGGNLNCRVYTIMDDIPEFKDVVKAFEYWDEMWRNK